jgi:hypothetical protein
MIKLALYALSNLYPCQVGTSWQPPLFASARASLHASNSIEFLYILRVLTIKHCAACVTAGVREFGTHNFCVRVLTCSGTHNLCVLVLSYSGTHNLCVRVLLYLEHIIYVFMFCCILAVEHKIYVFVFSVVFQNSLMVPRRALGG